MTEESAKSATVQGGLRRLRDGASRGQRCSGRDQTRRKFTMTVQGGMLEALGINMYTLDR